MGGVNRLVLVVVVAALAFGAALVKFRDAPTNDCLASARNDSSYHLAFTKPLAIDDGRYQMVVTRQDRPVVGARVCLNVAMGGMSAMGVINRAREVQPGVYEFRSRWGMPGPWVGTALVKEQGKPAVSVPLSFQVG